ncbi:p450 domain containing protein, partial [Asbolus verrucosus]
CRLYYYASKLVGPPAFPLIESALYFFGGTHGIQVKSLKISTNSNPVSEIFETGLRIVEKYKPLFKFWFGTKFTVVVTHPEDVKIILNSCLEKDRDYKFTIPALGCGLVTLPVWEWKQHRKIIGLTFNKQVLNSFVEIFASYSHILVEKLEEILGKGCVDVYPILSQCTLDMICNTTMGTNVNAMNDKSQYIIESKKRAKYQMEDLYDGITKKKALLDHLIDLTYKEANWSDKETIEETKTIIITGSETTASAVCYLLIVMGMHQDIQDLVLEEIDSITGSSGKDIAVEDLTKMTYLDRVIKETLRLFPNHILPEGSAIAIPIFFIHEDPDFWTDPLTFDPDRFLPEEVAKRHPYTFLPFSGGPRNCLGG